MGNNNQKSDTAPDVRATIEIHSPRKQSCEDAAAEIENEFRRQGHHNAFAVIPRNRNVWSKRKRSGLLCLGNGKTLQIVFKRLSTGVIACVDITNHIDA